MPKSRAHKLTFSDSALILKLSREGLTQTAIAQRFDIDQSRVSQILDTFADTRELATAHVHSKSYHLANAAVTGAIKAAARGNPEATLEMLDSLGVLERRDKGQQGAGVTIMIGAVGAPVLSTLRVLDTTATEAVPALQEACQEPEPHA